jgi:WhiB family transcriptional regulator, redox-sensing transcriptional regulator
MATAAEPGQPERIPAAASSSSMEAHMDTEWMSAGKCRDLSPAIFFPSDGVGVQAAQRICAECPVAHACLEYALEERVDHGVWGGKSERERRRLLRRRRISHAVAV